MMRWPGSNTWKIMSWLHIVFQLLQACSKAMAILVTGSWYCELGKEEETGKLTHALTFHRGQNWVTPDNERRNKIIYFCCSQRTKDPIFQVPNPAPNTQFFLPSLIRGKVKIGATEVNGVSPDSHQRNWGYWCTTNCVLQYKDFF